MTTIEFHRGDDAEFAGAVKLSGAAYPLAGASLRFTAKLKTTDADGAALIVKTIGAGIVVTDVDAGLYRVDFVPADTAAMVEPIPRLVFDVQLRTAAGKTHTIDEGFLYVKPDASRTSP